MARSALLAGFLLLLGFAAAGQEPVHERIEGVSSDQFESHPAWDPLTGDFYFVRSTPQFSGWQIFRRRCTASGWTAAEPFPFAATGVEADPFFTADGRRFYFISSRVDPPAKTKEDLDIWTVEREASGRWGKPVRLPAPVNSGAEEWFPRTTRDGTLYFGSGRPGGAGKTDIYAARQVGSDWQVRNLGGSVSTAEDDYEFEPSHDGGFAVLMSGGALFRFDRAANGWGERKPLLAPGKGFHVGPLLSPSGRTLLFARRSEGLSGEIFRLDLGDAREKWPPSCPAK